jgi:hypothetical protein
VLPIGTRVVVRKADHLGNGKPPRRLVGRTGVVIDHENGMNIVSLLTPLDWITGLRAFADTDVISGVTGPIPWFPCFYRVRGYLLPATSPEGTAAP